MQTEIEASFTDIDPEQIRERLKNAGAERKKSRRLMKRKVFDFPNKDTEQKGAWARVRDEGGKITMSYKRLLDRTLSGVQEVNLEIDDFDSGCRFLSAVGLIEKAYQETYRESWSWKGVQIEIDEWPWIPPFVEIEGSSEEVVKEAASQLGFEWTQAMFGSVENIYQQHYDVTEDEVDTWPSITFVPVPEWLEKRRKHTSQDAS